MCPIVSGIFGCRLEAEPASWRRSRGSSCGGGRLVGVGDREVHAQEEGLVGFGSREVHFLQEGLEAGIGAEGRPWRPRGKVGHQTVALLNALL